MNVVIPGRALCVVMLIAATFISRNVVAAEAAGSTLAEATGWVEVAPEGTTCWDGSPWHFWYHGGSADKLAVWFEGGGACWNAALCDVEGRATFKTGALAGPPPSKGLFDQQRKSNPLRDFSVVLLPYCTGDVHIGRRTVEYRRPDGTRFRFAHEGARNTIAAFDWLKSRGFDPRTLFVSGESAGAVAAAYWAVEIGDRWPQAQLTVLGDSAGGYRSLGVNSRAAAMGRARRAAGASGVRRTRSRVLRVVLHRRRATSSERAARAGQFRRRCRAAPLHVAVGHAGEAADEAVDLQSQRSAHRRARIPQLHLSGQAARHTADRRRLLDALRRPESRQLGGRSARGTTAREPLVRRHGTVNREPRSQVPITSPDKAPGL